MGRCSKTLCPRLKDNTELQGDTIEIKFISEPGDVIDYIFGYFKKDETMSRNQQTYFKGVNLYRYYYWSADYVIDPNEQDFDYNVYEDIENTALFGELTLSS
jgi:hypothetical protein